MFDEVLGDGVGLGVWSYDLM